MTGLGLLVAAVTALPVDRLLLRSMQAPWDGKPGDVLIVLAAESMPDIIGRSTYWRCVYAVRVWRDGGYRKVVVSGGTPITDGDVAGQMRQFLVSQGVPDSAILLETHSHDTHENALYTARLIGGEPGRKVLLTSDYHIRRAYLAFRKAGIEVAPHGVPDLAKRTEDWLSRWDVFLQLMTEEAKTLNYWWRGWI